LPPAAERGDPPPLSDRDDIQTVKEGMPVLDGVGLATLDPTDEHRTNTTVREEH